MAAGRVGAVEQQLEQAEQRGRRVADRDHRAVEPVAPAVDGGGRPGGARGARPASATPGSRSVQTDRRCRPAAGPG